MNSSTSSSKIPKSLRVLVVTLLVLLLVEGVTRTVLFRASKDINRFRTYPQRAKTLNAQADLRIALIGNSATQRGVDTELFSKTIGDVMGIPNYTDMLVADSSKVSTWRYILKRFFWDQNVKPDLIVINYYGRNLEDGMENDPGRLAQFFTTPQDWPDVFSAEITDFGGKASFIIASGWATFAVRERIREQLLGRLVPHYKEYAESSNNILAEYQQRTVPTTGTPVRRVQEYRGLRAVLRAAQERGCRICFVAFPMLPPKNSSVYPLDARALSLIRQAGMDFVDLRHLPSLPSSYYVDDIHLNEEGKAIYSRILAEAVQDTLAAHPLPPRTR
jgi:hypothetical protein